MKTSQFDFDLPESSIAAYPHARRDGARLMKVDRHSGGFSHHIFSEIEALLPRGALLVLNDSRVMPARLIGRRQTGGQVEVLLIRRRPSPPRATADAADDDHDHDDAAAAAGIGASVGAETWEAIGRNLGGLTAGAELEFAGGLSAVFVSKAEDGRVTLRLQPPSGQDVAQALESVGDVPIPPYIVAARRRADGPDHPAPEAVIARDRALDRERYQTVYASPCGSVAAPTAGLHFTSSLLSDLQAAGHEVVAVSLHVGLGTFRPVKTEDLAEHQMESEWYSISADAAARIEQARRSKRPIVAVGTTVVRTLESAARAGADASLGGSPGEVRATDGAETRLFLRPGAAFHVVTDLVTNFHLPRSTLLMLVSAFAGREHTLDAYRAAIETGYRFYSYGDAMLIRGTAI